MNPMDHETTQERFEILEGPLTDLHWARGTVNLLTQLQKHAKAKNTAIGAAAAATDLYGTVASSAMLVMYDGEDVENFTCRIGGNIVCGQFSGADHLKNGDHVKAVVTRQGNVYLAHAILRPADEVLWLPVGCSLGSNADLRGNLRIAKWLTMLGYVVLSIVGYYIFSSEPFTVDSLGLILMFLVIPPLLAFSVAFWVHKDTRPLAQRAEKIFEALGFPYPEDLNMPKGLYFLQNANIDRNLSQNMLSMFYYKKAIDFEKQRRAKNKILD